MQEDNIFIKVNIKELMGQKSSTDITDSETSDSQAFTISANKHLRKDLNWKQELEDRLIANRSVTPDQRKNETDIVKEFWFDCFTTLWPADLYKNLEALGNYFKNDLLNWGFTAQQNPIVAFLNQKYVQTNLVKTKKLNTYSYSALHNAIIKKLVSYKELEKANNYNILYCLALYDLAPKDIFNYLKLQTNVLNPSKGLYSDKTKLKNRRVFLQADNISANNIVKKAEAQLRINEQSLPKDLLNSKLNSLELIHEILIQLDAVQKTVSLGVSDKELANLINNLNDVSDAFTLLYFLSGKSPQAADFIAKHQAELGRFSFSSSIIKLTQDLIGKALSDNQVDNIIQEITDKFF